MSEFNEDYFIRGKDKGVSNYENYRWMEERTLKFANNVYNHFKMDITSSFLDFGCARGYTVKAMRILGVTDSKGYDISEWAIANCDPDVVGLVSSTLPLRVDYALAKDVLEHIRYEHLVSTVKDLISRVDEAALFIVPLAREVNQKYVRYEDELDVTHMIRWTLHEWMEFFWSEGIREEFTVEGSWHIPGLKPTSLSHPRSCGFITLRRTSQG